MNDITFSSEFTSLTVNNERKLRFRFKTSQTSKPIFITYKGSVWWNFFKRTSRRKKWNEFS